jgi:hypothetical protein
MKNASFREHDDKQRGDFCFSGRGSQYIEMNLVICRYRS